MQNSIDFDSVLSLVDKTINPTYLSPTQEIVLREVWKGKTYSEMAYDNNYDPEYIKSVGCNLWQTLSRAFNNQINKSNFVPFMRQKIVQSLEVRKVLAQDNQNQFETTDVRRKQICHWTTAPNTKSFIDRREEINLLSLWSQEPDCRCIVVSGMVGCGKTALATKFAREVQDSFDYVIWFSLLQTPSLKTLLINYLTLLDNDDFDRTKPESLELSFLLSKFINRLKEQKILLIVDGLQGLMQIGTTNVSYKKKYEEYGQLLRSVISTNHQSLLVATSRIKPKLLEYYSKNQVKFLDLQGFNAETTQAFFQQQHRSQLEKSRVSSLTEILQGNPQLLKIAGNYLDDFCDDDDSIQHMLQDISLLEEIKNLLEIELSYSSHLEKEIIYWLATSCSSISLKELTRYIEQSQRKLEFLQSLNSLVKRSLIIKTDKTYSLMPLMKVYLRRKLVKQALEHSSI